MNCFYYFLFYYRQMVVANAFVRVCVNTGRAKGGKGEGGGEEEEPGGGLGQLSCVLWLQAASCVFSGDVLDGERVTVIALGVFGNRQWQMSNHIQDSSLVYYILAETLDAKL